MKKKIAEICLFIFALTTQLSAEQQSPTNHEQTINQSLKCELDLLRNQYGFPGATVAYVLSDGRAGEVAIGLADIEAKTAMTSQSQMLAASIGKSFVAATTLALAKEGKLNLDDPLSKWLDDRAWFSRLPNHSAITLRQLLTHSSGLPDYVHMKSFARSFSQDWSKPGNPFPPEKVIAFVLDQPALFEAGKGFGYSDTGYILLGLVIEAASGNSYYKEVTERFLRPLNLKMTSPSDRRELPGLAAGYTSPDYFGLPRKTTTSPGLMAWNPGFEWTGGGLISTSRDLAQWAKLLYEGNAMNVDYLDDLLRSVPVGNDRPGVYYGAGVVIDEKNPEGLTLGHGGVIPGYTSSMRYYSKYHVAIAFQINTDVGVWDHSTELANDMERRLAKIILHHQQDTSVLTWIDASENRAIETLISLASIVSPSGEERDRALFVAERMREIGLTDVAVDVTYNVVGRIKGRSGKAIVFITMLDDLPEIAELQKTGMFPPHRDKERVVGPATELQSLNAAMLLAAEALVQAGITPEHDIVFASVAQEETGCIGMKALYESWQDRAIAWVEVLGDGHKIVYGAPFIHWWKVMATGSGGHTEETNLPNLNLGIARAVESILDLPYPKKYEDTFINIGIIQSGDVYNHKPKSGWFSLDLRSMKGEIVREIETDVRTILGCVEKETGIPFEMESVTVLNGGQVPGARESRLVQIAEEISVKLGYKPEISEKGCCNMIIPISHGRLAIGLHGDPGGQRATAEEWADIPSMIRTAKYVTLLAEQNMALK